MSRFPYRVEIFDKSEIVGLFDIYRRSGPVEKRFQRANVGRAVFRRNYVQFHTFSGKVRSHYGENVGAHVIRYEYFITPALFSHQSRFRSRRSAVVKTCVGHVHSRQKTYISLILEHRPEDTLRHFRLIRSISRHEFAARGDRFHHGGDIVPVSSRAAHTASVNAVQGSRFFQFLVNFLLRKSFRKLKLVGSEFDRDVLEKLVYAFNAYRGEHFLAFPLGYRYIIGHLKAPPYTPLRP